MGKTRFLQHTSEIAILTLIWLQPKNSTRFSTSAHRKKYFPELVPKCVIAHCENLIPHCEKLIPHCEKLIPDCES